jgi:hypothetical protein
MLAALVATGCGGSHQQVKIFPPADPMKAPAVVAVNSWVNAVEAGRWGRACALSSARVVGELGGTWQCRRYLRLTVRRRSGWGNAFIASDGGPSTVSVPATLSLRAVREQGRMRVSFFVTDTKGDPRACSLLIRQVAGLATVSAATRRDLRRNCHYRL